MSTDGLAPPIILLGNVRSGTSMIQSFFDLVPDLCTWFEPRTVWAYADPSRRHDHFTERDATPRVKRYIRKRFARYQREHGGRRVMEKTPSNILRARYIHEIFPESKLIFVIREPLAQLSSAEFRWHNAIHASQLKRRILETPKSQLHWYASRLLIDHTRKRILRKKRVSIWGVRYPGIYDDRPHLTTEQLIAKQWSEGSRICREDCDEIESFSPGTVLRVRYEDIIADPIGAFRALCDHTGIEPTDKILSEVSSRADTARAGKWKRLGQDTIRSIEPFIRDEMRVHGYALPDALPSEEEARRVLESTEDISQGGMGSAGLKHS